jgi:uncharacterized protein
MIEAGENVLRDLGFYDVRVRHHELKSAGLTQHLARIEVGPEELKRFVADGVATKVAASLKQAGYHHVTLDLQGYRRGSVNEVLMAPKPAFL